MKREMINKSSKNNKKGFTLVELIATIVVLALVVGISSYAVIGLIQSSKEKNYELLITSIKDAAETYYQECTYSNNTGITCGNTVTLNDLLTYGYLKGNDSDHDNSIINPKDNENIGSCQISISYLSGKVKVSAVNPTGSCPTEY